MILNILFEAVRAAVEFSLAIIWSVIHFFIWPREKNVVGQRVLITGSGNGIGRLMAVEFARRGAKVICWDVDAEGNEKTAGLVREAGALVYPYTVDVSNKSEIKLTADLVKSEVGDVDILVNNAGIVTGKKILDTTDEEMERTFKVNTLSHYWTTKVFLPSMFTHNHGHIVNIASSTGLIGCNKLGDFSASKFGDVGFTDCLDLEVMASGHHGVHTTLICPNFISTGMFEGANTRFPRLLPALDPDWAAARIVKAILTNQKILYMPRLMYFLVAFKTILPVDAQMVLHKFIGATNFMDNFVGQKKKSR